MPNQFISPEDVKLFLKTRENNYQKCLNILKMRFREFMLSEEGEGKIYKIYSREEKQHGNEFKAEWKISDKVNEFRKGRKTFFKGKEKDIPPKPSFPIQDVADIIAFTVVCVYPSDIEIIDNFIKIEVNKNRFILHYERKIQESGYYARHFVIGLNNFQFIGIRCELQVKTLLHDAWTAKTHDLIFKPEGELDERLRKQMAFLGDTLSTIDEQSELIRLMIQESWFLDIKRKEIAKQALLSRLSYEKSRHDHQYFDNILNELQKNESLYQECSLNSEELMNITKKIEEFGAPDENKKNACRVLALLATMRHKNDLDHYALDYIDRYIDSLKKAEERVRAINFKAMSLFCFGQLENAINVSEEALEIATSFDVKKPIPMIKGNLAYFYAELANTETAQRLDAGVKARKYIEEALKEDLRNAQKARINDTLGVVKIAFGETSEEIREGLRICKEALDESEEKELAVLFYEIHERRAFRRLLEWD